LGAIADLTKDDKGAVDLLLSDAYLQVYSMVVNDFARSPSTTY